MAKSKKFSSCTEPATRKSPQKTQKKSSPKKSPKEKVLKIIGEVQSNIGLELFKGITKLFPVGILKVVNEQGGGHINKSFQPLMESPSGAAGTSDVPVQKVSKKKKIEASKAGTSAMTDVANVGEKEVPSEGTVGATQDSEVMASKGKFKLKTQCKRKKDVISPAVGENLVEVEDKEEDQKEDVVTESVVMKKRRRKQVARTGPSKRPRKIKSSSKDVIIPASEAFWGGEEEKEEV
ncbi:hypothetical protein Dimus_008327 [Dionaea muscipula]